MQIFFTCRNLGLFSELEPSWTFLICLYNESFNLNWWSGHNWHSNGILIQFSSWFQTNCFKFRTSVSQNSQIISFRLKLSQNQIFNKLSQFVYILRRVVRYEFRKQSLFLCKNAKTEEIIKQCFILIHLWLKLYSNIYEA